VEADYLNYIENKESKCIELGRRRSVLDTCMRKNDYGIQPTTTNRSMSKWVLSDKSTYGKNRVY
jgi:hypothetical protein